MPKQKLIDIEKWVDAFITIYNPRSTRESLIETVKKFRDNTVEACASECDTIDNALNDGTITRQEQPDWPYDSPDIFHANASNYVERAAINIRALISKTVKEPK